MHQKKSPALQKVSLGGSWSAEGRRGWGVRSSARVQTERVWLPPPLHLFSLSAGLRAPVGNHHGQPAALLPETDDSWFQTFQQLFFFLSLRIKNIFDQLLQECDHVPQILPTSKHSSNTRHRPRNRNRRFSSINVCKIPS